MKEVFIVSALRTPMGSFGGSLSSLSAVELGVKSISAVIEATGIPAGDVDEVFMGNVCQANLGQAPARQTAIGAGLPNTVPCTTINKVCSSGMKSIMFGAQAIQLGQAELIVAGGMESMSNIPYYLPKLRWGSKYGHQQVVDGLQKDGLTDAYDEVAMGNCGDLTASKYNISREAQDEYAIRSYERAASATTQGSFADEIIPISIPQRKGDPITISEDEEYKKVRFDKIPSLRPAFNKDGTVTAANASTLNDGASALLLASSEAVNKYSLHPIAKIRSYADAAHEPMMFTTAPTKAAPKALQRAGLGFGDVDFYEVNEAFAVVPMAFAQECGVSYDQMNVNGGAVSLGHPLGCSGARIVTTLAHTLANRDAKIGCATLCNGGGGASALVIEKI